MTQHTDHHPGTLLRDRLLVTAAAVLWLVGTALGSGLVGDSGVSEEGDGLFTDSTTFIAPDGPAFSIWSVIYVGLAGYVVWQWLPATNRSAWARASRLPAAPAIALNGVWLLVVFADLVWLSVAVILGIALSLGLVLARTSGLASEGLPSQVWVALTFGLYLGWVCVATCANIASALLGAGFEPDAATGEWITVGVLAVVVVLTAWLLRRTDQRWFRLALAAAVVWGSAWVSTGRFTGDLRSDVVGYAAAATAVVVAALGAWAVLRADRAADRDAARPS